MIPTRITDSFTKEVTKTAQLVLDALVKLPEYPTPEKKSGYLCVYGPLNRDGIVLIHQAIGDVDSLTEEKRIKYYNLSHEKVCRLLENQGTVGHLSSWQSRDGIKYWGGAVKCDSVIISFSGLPELGDEAVCLVIGVKMGFISIQEAENIAEISSNNHFQKLLDACQHI